MYLTRVGFMKEAMKMAADARKLKYSKFVKQDIPPPAEEENTD
jgi:hypothetical protein